jgi:hypothetical protein
VTIKTFLDKALGLEVSVILLRNSMYVVVLYDIDEMQYLPDDHPPFLDRDNAIRYAERQVMSI